jgi:uncharacterized protein YbaR (Trm112 family)
MFVPLTDIVTCPRCGPEWGLVLLAERVAERRVLEGRFGCPNCRETFAVASGFADLRPAGTESEAAGEPLTPTDGRDAAIRLAALMGLGGGPPRALLSGPVAAHARALAALMEGFEVVVVGMATADWDEEAGVSRFAAAGRLPFRDRCMGGVTLSGPAADAFLEEGARVLSGAGRMVLEGAPAGCEARLADAGLEIVAREGGTVVARRK